MSAPSGKPSPEGTRPSGLIETMAIENADTDKAANDIPIESDAHTPSERSRSDKRERCTILPQNETTQFSHRGYDFHASREGLPASSAHMHMSKTEVHHHERSEVHKKMNLQQIQHDEMHVNVHNPAATQTVE